VLLVLTGEAKSSYPEIYASLILSNRIRNVDCAAVEPPKSASCVTVSLRYVGIDGRMNVKGQSS
jgi:hypothetical protein